MNLLRDVKPSLKWYCNVDPLALSPNEVTFSSRKPRNDTLGDIFKLFSCIRISSIWKILSVMG